MRFEILEGREFHFMDLHWIWLTLGPNNQYHASFSLESLCCLSPYVKESFKTLLSVDFIADLDGRICRVGPIHMFPHQSGVPELFISKLHEKGILGLSLRFWRPDLNFRRFKYQVSGGVLGEVKRAARRPV